ncbi:MAG: metallophosphoesterase family protein, partial [Bacteroidales bacterium]
SASYVTSKQFRFSMPGNESENFRFAVIADSHIDQNSDTAVYQMTLKNIGEYGSDFLVDMGDTFMTDKYGQEYTLAQGQYLAQRYYLGSVCHSLPLYLIQGNHDGETGDKRAEMTAWATRMSEMYFPGPDPKNYYYWERGDALMVVLDPFTYTSSQGSRDPWQRTLGEIQYHWLENVLKNSAKKFKFVFIHNLVGGVDVEGQSRGGAEAALYYEWGGKNWEGADEFSTKRNNWNMPIHQLLKKYGVQVVFHGHDHLYAKQEYDGIIYQCVQQPGLKRYDKLIYGDTYGYKNGILKYNPGHIRVKISPMNATIEYVSHLNTILDTYTL